jgi:5-methylcytosine-specific restriction endonuclease McrA
MSSKDHRTEYDAWYDSAVWRRRSRAQRQRQPLCEDCLDRGLVIPAEVADHVEPHKGNWNAFRLGALRSLCKLCHDSSKKRTEARGYSSEIGVDGWPTDPRHPAYAREKHEATFSAPPRLPQAR